MKLTTLLLVAININVWATGFGQKVTISGKDLPLEKVFSIIKKQTGYAFFYDYNIFQGTKPVTLNLKDADIEDAMRVCLWGQDLDFSITNKTVSVIKKPGKKPETAGGGEPRKTVKVQGIILNEAGQPLSGASVTIKENKKSTLTNEKGEFYFSALPSNSTLLVSYIGYTSKIVTVNDSEPIRIRLSVAVNELDETVVQAYGTTTHRLSTGNISKLTAKDIEKQPVMNPLQALQGRIAGLDVIQTNGFGSAPFKVELRGRNAIGDFPSDPLYIIDGVPLTILEVGGNSSYNGSTGFLQTGGGFNGPANGQSPLFSINPADIESIEVLKDADATAIYGSRGSNGVILITTKKGKPGKSRLDLNAQYGITKVTRFWDMLNTSEYLKMRREAFQNDYLTYGPIPGLTIPDAGNAYDLLVWDTTRYTNWQREFYNGMGKATNVQASLFGGDSRTSFRIGAGYNRTTNIMTVSGADQRASLSFNLTHKSLDQRLSISFTSAYSYTQSDMSSLPGYVTMAPNAPAIYDSTGNLNYEEWRATSVQFPFASLKQPYTAKTNFLNSNFLISFQAARGLKFSTSLGYNTAQANQQNLIPISSQDPAQNPTGSAYFGNNGNKNWIIEPQINYDAIVGTGKISTLIGASIQQTTTDGLFVAGSGYTNDALLRSISNAPIKGGTDNYGQYKYAAIFGRITYNLSNKYIININARRDGSSKFGPGRQYGNFGSIGAAWIFTEEKFLKDIIPFLNFGKIRGSYGTTGSDVVGDYKYISRWTSSGTQLYGGIQPLQPIQLENPNYQWQVNKKLELAIDMAVLKERINISASYYRNRCGNQLVNFPLPYSTGFNNVTANSPALVQNSGWEFIVNAKVVDSKNFRWSVTFNTAINKNKLVAYPMLDQSPYKYLLVVGQPLNVAKLLNYIGVNPQTGLYSFQDKNKDGQITVDNSGKDDRYVYSLTPKFFGGLGLNFSYKDLQLGLFFNIKKQTGPNALYQGALTPGTISNQPVEVLNNHWQKPGDIATVAKYTTQPFDNSYNRYYSVSTGGYTDASFIRLNNLSISYNLSKEWVKKAGMQGCSIFLYAQNLFVITNYKGIDPETQNFGGLPPAKTITGGLSFNF